MIDTDRRIKMDNVGKKNNPAETGYEMDDELKSMFIECIENVEQQG